MAAIEAVLPADATVLADPGDALFAAADLHLREDSHFLASSFWASSASPCPPPWGPGEPARSTHPWCSSATAPC